MTVKGETTSEPPATGSQAWMDEVIAWGCYRCGHEGSETDPCDESCEALPLSWSQMQAGMS